MKKLVKQTRRSPSFKEKHFGFQNPVVVTLESGTSRTWTSSWSDKPDRKPSLPRWSTSWSEASQRLQSVLRKLEEYDPRSWKRGILRIMRNGSQGTVLLSSLLSGRRNWKIVLVEFAWVMRTKCVDWIENDLMHYRFRIMWWRKDDLTEPDMGNQKNKSVTTSLSTQGRDARKRVVNQNNIMLALLTDFSKIQDTVRCRRSMDGQKLSVKKWTN